MTMQMVENNDANNDVMSDRYCISLIMNLALSDTKNINSSR